MNGNVKAIVKAFECQSNRFLSYVKNFYSTSARFRKPIYVEMQVSVTMYYLSDEGRFRKTANALGIAKNTVPMIIRRVTKAISNYLAYKYIKLLRIEEKVNESCSLVFEKHGFPQCLGGCRWDSYPDKAAIWKFQSLR